MKTLKRAAGGAILAVCAAGLHYALPQVDVVRIVGTDVKRVDTQTSGSVSGEEPVVRTADVYFILAETPEGAVRNYRNEDALLYGKFDSSDLHTKMRSVSQNVENTVAVRHYGWRIPFFSMFPNATSAWEVEPGYRHLPVFNIVFLSLLAGGIAYAGLRIRKMRALAAQRRAEREAQRAAERAALEVDQNADRDAAMRDFLGGDAGGSGSGSSE